MINQQISHQTLWLTDTDGHLWSTVSFFFQILHLQAEN